jgi:hypothetical protein
MELNRTWPLQLQNHGFTQEESLSLTDQARKEDCGKPGSISRFILVPGHGILRESLIFSLSKPQLESCVMSGSHWKG